MGSVPIPDTDRIEQALLQEVEQAKTTYDEAKTECAKLMERSTELGLNHPDGRTAQRKGNAIRDTATERYAKALRALTDFLLSKRLP
jgi:hypothetical protein